MNYMDLTCLRKIFQKSDQSKKCDRDDGEGGRGDQGKRWVLWSKIVIT